MGIEAKACGGGDDDDDVLSFVVDAVFDIEILYCLAGPGTNKCNEMLYYLQCR